MTLDQFQSFLLCAAGLNYAALLLAFAAWVFAGEALYRLHARWFRIDRARYDATAYLVFGLYKLGIWLLFLVPWLALRLSLS